ncbi:MAG: VWA domain-containing protein [archaeon]
MKNTRGFVFTMDAVIALILFISVLVLVSNLNSTRIGTHSSYEQLHYTSEDAMEYLSEQRILDDIGTYWVDGNCTAPGDGTDCQIAANLAKNNLEGILTARTGFRLKFSDQVIYESGLGYPNESSASEIAIANRVASGYEIGKPVEGFKARAYLTSISNKRTNEYAYFGGYVGEGNITRYIYLPTNFTIRNVTMEMDVGSNFTLYINSQYSGNYTAENLSEFYSTEWNVSSSYHNNFNSGQNEMEIVFHSGEMEWQYIAGGFLRVTYDTNEMNTEPETNSSTYEFPGIDGFINVFSSFYVPGTLTNMEAYLHYYTQNPMNLTIGNITVHEASVFDEEVNVTLTNSQLSQLLDYNFLSNRTVPVRLGTKPGFYSAEGAVPSDIVLTTDVSSSMDTQDVVGAPGMSRLDVAKVLDSDFVNYVLSVPWNRVGLISYHATVIWGHTIDLTNNNATLQNRISSYGTSTANTCFACAIAESEAILVEQSSALHKRSIVLMGDGTADKCYGIPAAFCTVAVAKQQAINLSCDAFNDYGIIIYTVGFGTGADAETLQAIADCANGTYFSSNNFTELKEIYKQIANLSTNANVTYSYQRANTTAYNNTLYTDSYIRYNYTPIVQAYSFGNISLTLQTERFGGEVASPYKNFTFQVPTEVLVTDAKTTSYSGSKWTDRVQVKNQTTGQWHVSYTLADYSTTYYALGDPFTVQLPLQYFDEGENFSLGVGTGNTPYNATGGSPHNRLIYTVMISERIGFGGVFSNQTDAEQDALERLQNALAERGINININNIEVNSTAALKIPSLWGPSRFTLEVWQ